jgi:hypothetical protein
VFPGPWFETASNFKTKLQVKLVYVTHPAKKRPFPFEFCEQQVCIMELLCSIAHLNSCLGTSFWAYLLRIRDQGKLITFNVYKNLLNILFLPYMALYSKETILDMLYIPCYICNQPIAFDEIV